MTPLELFNICQNAGDCGDSLPRGLAEFDAAVEAAGYQAEVPAGFLDALDRDRPVGASVWPFADEALAAAYCDLAVARGLLAVADEA